MTALGTALHERITGLERALAEVERELADYKTTLVNVSGALGMRMNERDEARAMVARMRPIVSAVHAWTFAEGGSPAEGRAERVLIEAHGDNFTADMLEEPSNG